MTKMRASDDTVRWAILAGIAGIVLLLRIFRGEWLQGKNPLLFFLVLAALYILYRIARVKK